MELRDSSETINSSTYFGTAPMTDRAVQALHLLGLDPIAESHADGHSYGFRRERRCADAMAQTHVVLSHHHGPEWILEGDIKACFQRVTIVLHTDRHAGTNRGCPGW